MKFYYENIAHLCAKNTVLTEEDIKILAKTSEQLIAIAQTEKLDVFINCMCADGNGCITVSQALCDDTMYNMSTVGLIIRGEDEPAVLRTLRYGIETRDMWATSYTTTAGNMIVQRVSPIKNGDVTIGALIRERRLLQAEVDSWSRESPWIPVNYGQYPYLKYSEWLAECVHEAVIIVDEDGIVVFRNQQAKIIYHEYGYIYDIMNKPYNSISMHGNLVVGAGIENAFHEEELSTSGHYYHIKQYCYYDNSFFYIIILRDITQEKEKEENLVLKSVVLREAHHRIKNNLQTIYNLLDMQRRRVSAQESVTALGEAMGRIMSIASSYEMLMMRGTEQISITDTIRMVIDKFMVLIKDVKTEIEVSITGDDIGVDADCATDIVLVINELLQNSFKYAFVGKEKGHISICLLERPLYSEITVADDGVGFDWDKKLVQSDGMGLQIARNIVINKLKGNLSCQSDSSGTKITFDFKCHKST